MPSITYYELSSYNEGQPHSRTFDLECTDKETHLAEIAEWLEELSETLHRTCEEYIVADTEGVPNDLVGDYALNDDFFEYQDAVDNSYLDPEVFEAGIYLGIPVGKIEEVYAGSFDTVAEFADDMLDTMGVWSEIPEWLRCHIDLDAVARDLMCGDYMEHEGKYFIRN